MTFKPDLVIPRFPQNDEEKEAAMNDSLLGWKMSRQLPPEQRLHLLHSIDSENEEYKGNIILQFFVEALQQPFEGGGQFGIESLVGDEHIAFAYTGGYLFENIEGHIQMYLAKNKDAKARPFGDFHDLAAGQFEQDVGESLAKMRKAERCLFFHTFNTANGQIEYFIIAVDTLHDEQTQVHLGEIPTTDFHLKYSDGQIIDFEKKFSGASYGITQMVISEPKRKHCISAALATEQMLPSIYKRANLRINFGMDFEQVLREGMREKILSRTGVRS